MSVGDRVVMPFNVGCGFRKDCQRGFTGFCVTVDHGLAGGAYGCVAMGPWRGEFAEAHGIAPVNEDGLGYWWIVDHGSKYHCLHDCQIPPGVDEAAATATSGSTKDGEYVGSLNGEEGAGPYNWPHGIFVDRRKSEQELYVTDRANNRVQVYDLERAFKRSFGQDFLSLPSAFASQGDLMVIVELNARLAVIGVNDELPVYLGVNRQVCDAKGGPNNVNASGQSVRRSLREEGKFNSPHGLAADDIGNPCVAEWLIGGQGNQTEQGMSNLGTFCLADRQTRVSQTACRNTSTPLLLTGPDYVGPGATSGVCRRLLISELIRISGSAGF